MSTVNTKAQVFARSILLTWAFAVPLLAGGLAFTLLPLVRVGSACLLAGVILNAAQATVIATAQAHRG